MLLLGLAAAFVLWLLHGFTSTIWREIGSWCPRWSELIIRRRSAWLPRGQRQAFVADGISRMSAIPGDWGKFVYTYFSLRVGWRPAVGRRTQAFLLIAFLLLLITLGVEIGYLAAVLLTIAILMTVIGLARMSIATSLSRAAVSR